MWPLHSAQWSMNVEPVFVWPVLRLHVENEAQRRGCRERHLAMGLSAFGYRLMPSMAEWPNEVRSFAYNRPHLNRSQSQIERRGAASYWVFSPSNSDGESASSSEHGGESFWAALMAMIVN
jgi:hypothetical protein